MSNKLSSIRIANENKFRYINILQQSKYIQSKNTRKVAIRWWHGIQSEASEDALL